MFLTDKARQAMESVYQKFQEGDLSPIVKIASISLPEDAPSRKWTFRNRVLAMAQSGEVDNRGYNQWRSVGRQVRKGTHGVYILRPVLFKGDDGEEHLKGFATASVHPYSHTDAVSGDALTYEPRVMPPLMDVAQRLGVGVRWQPLVDALGTYNLRDDTITVGSDNVETFFHELAHAAHSRLDKLEGGQVAQQEVVADFTACVLMHLYGLGDLSGNTWQYIYMYAKDPLTAISKALVSIGEVLSLILEG